MVMTMYELVQDDDGAEFEKAESDIEFYLLKAIKLKDSFRDHLRYNELDINQIANMLREQEIFHKKAYLTRNIPNEAINTSIY